MNARTVVAALSVPLLAGVTAAAAVLGTGRQLRCGATADEARLPLPGDDAIPSPTVRADRAITIAAPPGRVWPWVAQLGQHKAGFYSYECLENLVGCEVRGRELLVPDWQHVRVGDPFPLHPDIVLRVAAVEPGRSLVVVSPGSDSPTALLPYDFAWTFTLTEVDADHTRLHVRELYNPRTASEEAVQEASCLLSAVMTQKMLRTIKRLAEG